MLKTSASTGRHRPQGVDILYEDRDILVVDKAAGLLTMATDREKEKTAYHRLTDYVRKGCSKSRNRIFIVHRLDREVSGILVFAKTPEAKTSLQGQWERTDKKYLAVVHGHFADQTGKFSSYLAENTALVVYSTLDKKKGKLAHTGYRVLKETPDYSLLEIDLLTGRKHQIRVHMAENGRPIVGDKKYGPGDKDHARLALHAHSITFTHPYSGKPISFTAPIPRYISGLVGGIAPNELKPR